MIRAVLNVVLRDEDQRVRCVRTLRYRLDEAPTERSLSACCVSGVLTPPNVLPDLR
jgi:hypothetical protein